MLLSVFTDDSHFQFDLMRFVFVFGISNRLSVVVVVAVVGICVSSELILDKY